VKVNVSPEFASVADNVPITAPAEFSSTVILLTATSVGAVLVGVTGSGFDEPLLEPPHADKVKDAAIASVIILVFM
jgi:hypothetical protein